MRQVDSTRCISCPNARTSAGEIEPSGTPAGPRRLASWMAVARRCSTHFVREHSQRLRRYRHAGRFQALEPWPTDPFLSRRGGCYLFADSVDGEINGPAELKRRLPISLVVVPVLAPLEHQEPFVTTDTVRRNLITTRASRNFRNYWYQYPDGFDDFAGLVSRTWPRMEILRPERLGDVVGMFCLEKRMSRELYWQDSVFRSGFNSSLISHDLIRHR